MKKVKLIDLLPTINEKLQNGETFSFMPNGISMLPTIVGGRDPVTIKKPDGRLKKYDIILYRRKSGQFVLHRIIGDDGENYILCGDNEARRNTVSRTKPLSALSRSICKTAFAFRQAVKNSTVTRNGGYSPVR